MKLPVLKAHETDLKTFPILIIDRIGVIGERLADEFSKDTLVVLLSSRKSNGNQKIIHIPFKNKIPQAPNNRYSKIFLIDDGEELIRKSAQSFISKARESGANFYFIGSTRNIDVSRSEEIISSYTNSSVLIFGDVFDKNILFDKNSSIGRFIFQARKNKKISVPGSGLALSFPVSFDDTIKLLIKASYLDVKQKIILLFPPHPITDISLANTFKKIDPDIKVDFGSEKKGEKIYIPKNSQHALSKYDLEDKIKDLDLGNSENRQINVIHKKTNKKNLFKPFLALILLILFVILLPLLTTESYLLLGKRSLNSAMEKLDEGDLKKTKKELSNAKVFFSIAYKTSQPLVIESKLLGMDKGAESIRKKARSGEDISKAGEYLIDGGEKIKNIHEKKSLDPKKDFSEASNLFKNALFLYQKVKAEGAMPQDLENDINNISPIITLFSNSADILPDVLGINERKKYLILLHDKNEIRPGGGVVIGYLTVEIQNLDIVSFKSYEVKEIDEKLNAKIDPPFWLNRYLSVENLKLKDSGSDPDFVNDAITASNIYSIVNQEKVDGVIGMNINVLENILSVIGSVDVDGVGRINHENVKDFDRNNNLSLSLSKAIFKGNNKDFSEIQLLKEIGSSILEKDLTFAFSEPSFQNVFTSSDWSSSLWDNREKENNKINDYLGISESNLSNSDVNRYVVKSVSKKINFQQNGKISSELTIVYKNSSKDKNYKNYLQLILPEAVKLNSISIDGSKLKIEKAVTDPAVYESRNFNQPEGIEVNEKNQMNKTIAGFLVSIPADSLKTIVLTYDLPYSFPRTQKSAKYSLKVFKQPGADPYIFDLGIETLETHRVVDLDKFKSLSINSDIDLEYLITQR